MSVWLCPHVHGYFTSVDAHAEECFFDRVSSGMKMSLTFEVVEGGFLDIDVKVGYSRQGCTDGSFYKRLSICVHDNNHSYHIKGHSYGSKV